MSTHHNSVLYGGVSREQLCRLTLLTDRSISTGEGVALEAEAAHPYLGSKVNLYRGKKKSFIHTIKFLLQL